MREGIIQYYLCFLPPRGVESILNIGGGTTDPYRKMLKPRCGKYANLDKRPGINVDFVCDVLDGTPFRDKEWTWVWCSEVIEHIPKKKQQKFVNEVVRICRNAIFTFPTLVHQSFHLDSEHVEVIANFRYKGFDTEFHRTKTGRCIVTIKQEGRTTSVDEWI